MVRSFFFFSLILSSPFCWAAPSCKGLGANGSYAQNVQRRTQDQEKLCGPQSNLAKQKDAIAKKLQGCQSLSDKIWKNGRKLPLFDGDPDAGGGAGDQLIKRLNSACEAFRGYVRDSTQLCADTDKAVSEQSTLTRKIDGQGDIDQSQVFKENANDQIGRAHV